MTTDNRTNELTEAQVEAAAKALHETRNPWIGAYGDWGAAGFEIKQAFRESARTALEAAARAAQGAGVAPQEPCPQPCEHLSAEDAREGRDCREHPCTCPTAPTFDREKLVEEARAVAGPKSLYAHTSVAHLLIRLADALAAPVLPSSTAPQDPECIMLHHPDGTPKSNDEIRSEAAAMREGAAPQAGELHETGNELRDADGDLISSGKHLRILQQGMYVCDTCTNVLGLNVRWDHAIKRDDHAPVLPSSGVDEDALAEVIEEARREWRMEWIVMQEREEPVPTPPDEWVARAVAEWLKGQK